jgi:hypothetical protein
MKIVLIFYVQLMGGFATPPKYKLFQGTEVFFRRDEQSLLYGAGHILIFDSNNNHIGHVGGEEGTRGANIDPRHWPHMMIKNDEGELERVDIDDCEILAELIDCHCLGTEHPCTLKLELTENTTHSPGGSRMTALLSSSLEDKQFFIDYLEKTYHKTEYMIIN